MNNVFKKIDRLDREELLKLKTKLQKGARGRKWKYIRKYIAYINLKLGGK